MTIPALQAGSGLVQSVGRIAVMAGTIVLVLMLVAMIGLAYKHFRGGGVEWPEEDEPEGDGGVSRGDDDDEWKYY